MISNPFNLMYGRIPNESFVERDYIVDNVMSVFSGDNPSTMAYAITGVRGSGKTVLLRDITNKFSQKKDWITVNLNFGSDLVVSLANKLLHAGSKDKLFLNWKITVTASIVSLTMGRSKEQITDPEIIIEELLKKIKKSKKRVLIAIDEVNNTKEMRYFANVFQTVIGRGYDVFLLMTGLENNILSLFNNKATSFLARTPKIKLNPLDIKEIAMKYQKHLGLNMERSIELAKITKGYAFAYQVLGYYLFEDSDLPLESILNKFDSYMRNNGYDVIFNDLTSTEKKFCLALEECNSQDVSEVAKASKMNSNNFNKYRLILIEKGIIESVGYGKISFVLPRFNEFVSYVRLYR
ncbi:MAG: AAA family ATPase [Bacilli bacterium]|nr:AAA family ATPase [Bacilli bacterium]